MPWYDHAILIPGIVRILQVYCHVIVIKLLLCLLYSYNILLSYYCIFILSYCYTVINAVKTAMLVHLNSLGFISASQNFAPPRASKPWWVPMFSATLHPFMKHLKIHEPLANFNEFFRDNIKVEYLMYMKIWSQDPLRILGTQSLSWNMWIQRFSLRRIHGQRHL